MSGAASRLLEIAAPRFPGGPLVVALSGGADSAVAAWVATRLDPPRPVRAVFVDHGWDHSAHLAQAAAAIATALDLPLAVVSVDAPATETGARDVRLAALERAAAGAAIVTGHHADDSAETIVVNLVRGAGSAGLAGIPPVRDPYCRPLLDVPGADVEEAAVELGLPFADDPSNRDGRHLRTRIRHDVIPLLETVAPGAGVALTRSGHLLAADDAALEALAGRFPLVVEPAAVRIPTGVLKTQPAPVASRIVRRAIRTLRPPHGGSAVDVAKVLAAAVGHATELTGGLRCEREGACVVLTDPALARSVPQPRVLDVPGAADFGPVVVRVQPTAGRLDAMRTVRRLRLAPVIGDRVTLRAAAVGERIAITGGTKLVRDAMAEAGIPRRLRAGWPVLDVRGKIAAVAGARVAAWAAPQTSQQRTFELITERSPCWTR